MDLSQVDPKHRMEGRPHLEAVGVRLPRRVAGRRQLAGRLGARRFQSRQDRLDARIAFRGLRLLIVIERQTLREGAKRWSFRSL
jgi:hypothetical protein